MLELRLELVAPSDHAALDQCVHAIEAELDLGPLALDDAHEAVLAEPPDLDERDLADGLEQGGPGVRGRPAAWVERDRCRALELHPSADPVVPDGSRPLHRQGHGPAAPAE